MLRAGGLVAYPTEAVYGLGCDPMNPVAVERLLRLKRRPWQKGLILIASDATQLKPYIQTIDPSYQSRLDASWPGPHTWLIPASTDCPNWVRGLHDTVAVRVSAHRLVQELCNTFGGAIISTSANHAGKRPLKTALGVIRDLGGDIDYCLHGSLGGAGRPTPIRDLYSDRVVR